MVQYVERQVVFLIPLRMLLLKRFMIYQGKGQYQCALVTRVENDRKKEALIEKLKNFSVSLTLTAHPTQFYPGNVLGIITDLESGIRANDLGNINLFCSSWEKRVLSIKKSQPHWMKQSA
jgi:phosphoenolpyruvate carboxylase